MATLYARRGAWGPLARRRPADCVLLTAPTLSGVGPSCTGSANSNSASRRTAQGRSCWPTGTHSPVLGFGVEAGLDRGAADRRSVATSRCPRRLYGVQTVVGLTRSEADEKYQRIRECIPLEGAVAWISGHFGPDLSKYDPNEIVQNIEIPGIQESCSI